MEGMIINECVKAFTLRMNIWGKIKIVVSDQQPFMIDGIIGFLGHYPDLYKVVGGYKDLKKAIAECNKSTA